MTPPPDEPGRRLIRTALDENLLVEAGAGSGKTTALVDRMLRLIASGAAPMDAIAAVTFTRKAAGELRQRFQERLERALIEGGAEQPAQGETPDPVVMARLQAGLADIDRAFMGTIHAFCARLLRERPLEARLDPAFRELTAPEERTLARRFWDGYLERLASDDTEPDGGILARLDAVDIRPSQLFGAFLNMNEASDVSFPVDDTEAPDPGALERVRRSLESILDDAGAAMPRAEPERGWDWLQTRVRRISYLRAVLDFDEPAVLLDALAMLCSSKKAKVTLNRWPVARSVVKELEARVNDLIQATDERPSPPARRLLTQWRAHRYGPAIELVRAASAAFAVHRRRTAQLTFHDLLVLATELLRREPAARRGLGERWRRLLVDEFQDTDPLQAELLFLLASDPVQDPEPHDGLVPWSALEPRPGALFVVGDPKQSIYRFRRADISLYARVRDRFSAFGRVIRLTANFRSTAPIGELVAGVFGPPEGGGDPRFPAEGTEQQAGYAPLLTQPPRTRPPRQGVFRYVVPDEHCSNQDALVEWETNALADWIHTRIDAGERSAEDFLVLTRKRRPLSAYARALEARGIPVVVSGATVGIEDELRELRLVLRTLADPGDPVLTLAALEGLFFGLDPDSLLSHIDAGGSLDLRRDRQPVGAVADGLARLRAWWMASREQPADQMVATIVSSMGLLPWAASGELGSIRAGALSFTLDLMRSAAISDDASLAGALDALDLVLDDQDSEMESPLEPGRGGAVRVMNLHKAKGLEAPVVILACPTGTPRHDRSMIVERDESGRSIGWCSVSEARDGKKAWQSVTILAAPRDWEARLEREHAFGRAERDRLLYVAATRAEHELVVATKAPGVGRRGEWEPFEPWLEAHAGKLSLEARPVPARRKIPVDVETLRDREAAVETRRREANEAHGVFLTVTGLVGGDPVEPSESDKPRTAPPLGWTQSLADSTGPGGFSWGNAVHATLDAAMNGLGGRALTSIARTALLENDRPTADGEPIELETLTLLVDRLRASDLWRRALAAEHRLTEHAFVLQQPTGDHLEGVIDLAFREADGWVVVDYKTAADDRVFALRLPRYQRQVQLYAEAWTSLTGEPVKEAIVWRVG